MHTAILQKIIDTRGYKSYLEIGLSRGSNWSRIKCDKKIGCDPLILIPAMRYGESLMYKNEVIYRKTSNDFFYYFGLSKSIDLIFIDGHHTFEQSLKDFDNSQRILSDNGLIVMHDTDPRTEMESMAYEDYYNNHQDYQGAWVGDVWKTILFLKQRGDVNYFSLNLPCGITILKKPMGDTKKPSCEINELPFTFFQEGRRDMLNIKPMTYLGEFLNAP